jgi:hypothetical protein
MECNRYCEFRRSSEHIWHNGSEFLEIVNLRDNSPSQLQLRSEIARTGKFTLDRLLAAADVASGYGNTVGKRIMESETS